MRAFQARRTGAGGARPPPPPSPLPAAARRSAPARGSSRRDQRARVDYSPINYFIDWKVSYGVLL